MENTPRLFMVNALMRQALVAVEEVMGRNGLTAVLRASDLDRYIDQLPPNDLNPAVSAADYDRLQSVDQAEVAYRQAAEHWGVVTGVI